MHTTRGRPHACSADRGRRCVARALARWAEDGEVSSARLLGGPRTVRCRPPDCLAGRGRREDAHALARRAKNGERTPTRLLGCPRTITALARQADDGVMRPMCLLGRPREVFHALRTKCGDALRFIARLACFRGRSMTTCALARKAEDAYRMQTVRGRPRNSIPIHPLFNRTTDRKCPVPSHCRHAEQGLQ